jgi:hypothetical protein
MNVVTLLIPHAQTSLVEEPVKGCFHHVAIPAEPTAMFSAALGDPGCHSTLTQGLTNLLFGVIGPIRQHFIRMFPRTTPTLLDVGNRIHQGHRNLRIVNVGPRVLHGQRRPLPVYNQMPFRTILAPIRGIRPGFRPPKSARTEQLSMAEVDQSMASARPNSSRRACQIFCQTRAACQSRRRRQQVMPLPQPISRGRYSQGVPVLSTNRIPVRQARSDTRGRPPFGLGGSGGMCPLMRSHSSSVSSGLAMAMSSMTSDDPFVPDEISDKPRRFL